MTDSYWRGLAKERIDRVHATLADNATLEERIKAIDDNRIADITGPYSPSWPKKMWQLERRLYLGRYGYKAKGQKPTPIEKLARDPVTGRPVIA